MNKLKFCLMALAVILPALIYFCLHTRRHSAEAALLPRFRFYQMNGRLFTSPANTAMVIIHIDPSCDLCKIQVKEIYDNRLLFENSLVLMVGGPSMEAMRSFASAMQCCPPGRLIILCDREDKFISWFGEAGDPEAFLYGRNGKQLKIYHGMVSAKRLAGLLQQ